MTMVPPSLLDPETLRRDTQGRPHHAAHVDEPSTANAQEGGIVQMYRTLCSTAECRANSAVLRYLQGRRDTEKPLTELPFQHFYVGPKGFEPILGLIQASQTAEHIDLRGNGLDNTCILALCQTLEKHLGVRSILLGDNPITVDGGKHLVNLLERNRRITELDLSGTNVYESMCKRMAMILQENIDAGKSGIALVPSRPSILRSSSASSSHSTAALRESRAEITLLMKASHTDTPLSSHAQRAKSSPMKRKGSPPNASSGSMMLEDGATTSVPKPKPPPPALVSREASRLTEKQRADLLAKYNERAQLYQQVVRSDASRAADRAREELMRIEQRGVVDAVLAVDAVAQPRPASGKTSTVVVTTRPATGHNNNAKSTPRKSVVDSPKKSVSVAGEPASPMDVGRVYSTARWSLSELPEHSEDADSAAGSGVVQRNVRRPTLNSALSVANDSTDDSNGAHVADGAIGFQMLPLTLTRDEQFRELFSKGCQQYNEKQLDAAYLTWNEAMDLAVTNKNREWMSVISNNLQRLSYEILVAEGVQYLDGQRLEEADRAFQLALDVANKAKNAAWEGEMHRARKNVQHAVFQRSHEAALRLFERAQNVKEQTVTSDDRFTIPGDAAGAVLREHSGAFVTEWSRMLLIKEAMEMWSDATMMARRISGSSGKVLTEVVAAAVDSVCAFLAQKHYIPEPHGNILSLQRTSEFSYVEALKLIDLWTDVVSKTQTSLANRTWDAVAASVLGNLFLATHQLPQALNQFEKLVDAGVDRQDNFLTGLGNTYLGILHWQRSSFSISEKCFVVALNEWKRLRVAHGRGGDGFDVSITTKECAPDGPSTSSASAREEPPHAHSGGPISVLASTVSVEYLNVMLSKCFTYLIRIMFTTSRYRDALEMLERGHLHRYKDRLHEKMLHNFTAKPTIDHIMAVAASLDTPLVYYETSYRFDWSTARDAYDVSQQLMVWVVVKGTEMKVVRVDVTNDFNVASVDVLIEQVRRMLCVLPIHDLGVQDSILTTLPDQSWREPLSKLYEILIHPIADFIAAHDMHLNSRGGAITVMPSSSLWLVPFNGLIMRDGKFLVEAYAVQLAFCGIQSAFSSLSARRVKDRALRKRVAVVYPADSDHSEVHMNRILADYKVPFPVDALRSYKEGERLMDTMSHGAARGVVPKGTAKDGGSSATPASTSASRGEAKTKHGEFDVVDDIHNLRDVITKSRLLHFATATATTADNDDGSSGALLLPAGQDDMSLLRASEIASYDIMAELVVMSQSHISADKIRTTKEPTLGLCRAFLSAGAASVVAAQWCTPDMMPVELMDYFYSILVTSKDAHRAKAMALATRKLLNDDKYRINPRAWCGFFLLGVGLVAPPPAQKQ